MLHRFAEWYKRLRHTYGYGVHSPFAYRLVRNVIRPHRGYSYYGEEKLLSTHPHDEDTRTACMLLRLCAELKINSVFVQPCCPPVYREALELSNPKVRHLTSDSDLSETIIYCLDDPNEDEFFDMLEQMIEVSSGDILWLRNLTEDQKHRLFKALRDGVMFHGPTSALIIMRPGMQPVSYSVRL